MALLDSRATIECCVPGMDPVVEYHARLSLRTSSNSLAEHRQRAERHAANHARPLPANHAITQILDSLDALSPSPVQHSLGPSSDSTASSRAFSEPSQTSAAPSVTGSSSPGSGIRYGPGLAYPNYVLDDQDSGSAPPPPLPPAARSSLPSSAAPSPSIRTGSTDGRSQSGKSPSRRWSFRRDKSPGKNKLSAESWVTQASRPHDQTVATESPDTPESARTQRSLRRKMSRESLRPQTADRKPVQEARVLSRAEQIIARSPPPQPVPRGRLYLNEDSTAVDAPPRFNGPSTSTSKGHDASAPRTTLDSIDGGLASPSRTFARKGSKSTITDSIPTRTSSLRKPSRSPNTAMKKDRRQRVPSSASITAEANLDVDIVPIPDTKTIPEASWADLGDDDETVRRIRQLREQRKSRLQTSPTTDSKMLDFSPSVDRSFSMHQHTSNPMSLGAGNGRPTVTRALTEPPDSTDAQVTPYSYGVPVPAINGTHTSHASHADIKASQWRHIPIPLAPQEVGVPERPNTARTTMISTRSLDYSYLDAMHALQSPEPVAPSPASPTFDISNGKGIGEVRYSTVSTTGLKDSTASAGQGSDRGDQASAMSRRKSRRKPTNGAWQVGAAAERPEMPRRDSIDEKISNYLNAPRFSRKVKHPITGRAISFSEVGDPDGAVVILCVGMGLTRYVTAFYDELATTLRLRLITPDRPGVGRSEPYPSTERPGPLSWSDDVLAICQELRIERFSLLAHSAGAIYALATALILPHLVNGKVHLLAPWIPLSQLEATNHPTISAPPTGALPRSQRFLRALPASFLRAANSSFMTATTTSLKPASKRQIEAAKEQRRFQKDESHGPPTQPVLDRQHRESMMLMDQFMPTTPPSMPVLPTPQNAMDNTQQGSIILSATALPTDPEFSFASNALHAAEHAERERQLEYTSRMTQVTWELATRDSNPATDLLVCLERNREIGFRYTDVTREVVITHGSEDKRVPIGNVKWLAEQMNLRAYMGRGSAHDLSRPRSRDDWEDPPRMTGGCEVRVLPGEGHRLMASAPIMSGVLTEIAGYWTRPRKGGPVGGEDKSFSI